MYLTDCTFSPRKVREKVVTSFRLSLGLKTLRISIWSFLFYIGWFYISLDNLRVDRTNSDKLTIIIFFSYWDKGRNELDFFDVFWKQVNLRTFYDRFLFYLLLLFTVEIMNFINGATRFEGARTLGPELNCLLILNKFALLRIFDVYM